MTKKINISKNILEPLYLKKMYSTHRIAKIFNCDSGVIKRRLKEYGILLRKPKEKITIPKSKLEELYINRQLSAQKTAEILGISSCSVYYKLKDVGIDTRPKKKIIIDKHELSKLYVEKNLPCSKIAKKFDCDPVTIFNFLKKFGIKTRSLSESHISYPKKKFQGTDEVKAYMIGFRLGDLNVRAVNDNSTIFIKSGTTKKEQCELIKNIYGVHGHYKIDYKNGVYQNYCNLDKSFSFLLPKQDHIEEWILNDTNCFFAFLGGYADAEGNFGVYQNRARFRLGTYDKNILKQIFDRLNFLGIRTKFRLESKAIMGKQNNDFYRIWVNEKGSLLKLINNKPLAQLTT
ncbi:LAGLIDADG family homing endonuclease [archaeon]|nr:LAGLIDADG family homing endonuclease [archaeon]